MKYLQKSRLLLPALLCMAVCLCAPSASEAQGAGKKKTTQTKAAPKKKKKTAAHVQRETSASVRKQEQNVNREISLTRRQIEENEASVKKNLLILASLEHDIDIQNRKVADLQSREKELQAEIRSCQAEIRSCEASLARLREHYMSSVKKLRIARKKANPLAYVFASKTFYQAWRRMRYIRKFNDWRERRETEIRQEMARLGELNDQLSSGQKQLQTNLAQQRQAQQTLAAKHSAQDEAVKSLRAHGETLRKYLAQKQAEANTLSAKVMSLIAAEQEEARLAEQRRKEAEAKEEARRKEAAEKAAREKAEAERKAAAEKAEAEKKAAQEKEKEKKKKEKETRQKDKKNPGQKESKKKQEEKKPETKKQEPAKESSGKNYAEARNRKPRGKSGSSESATTDSGAGFASAKGSLPRPVSGQFEIVSRFGRHPLPDLPDVMFDNPGIDAVVSKGASAQAVYPGTVTGVYVLPGFSTVVIVNHGEYYTVYGNIATPSVSKGDKVKQGQNLGKLLSDHDDGGRTTIHFEIYKNREKLNPEAWIR